MIFKILKFVLWKDNDVYDDLISQVKLNEETYEMLIDKDKIPVRLLTDSYIEI